jgi:hypothetical protein
MEARIISLEQHSMPDHHPGRPFQSPIIVSFVRKHRHEDVVSRRPHPKAPWIAPGRLHSCPDRLDVGRARREDLPVQCPKLCRGGPILFIIAHLHHIRGGPSKILLEAKCSDFDAFLSGYQALQEKHTEAENEKKISDELLVQKIHENEKASAAHVNKLEKDAKAIKQLQEEIKNLKTELAIARTDSDLMDQEIFGVFLFSRALTFRT